jgi:hypothetical protein
MARRTRLQFVSMDFGALKQSVTGEAVPGFGDGIERSAARRVGSFGANGCGRKTVLLMPVLIEMVFSR